MFKIAMKMYKSNDMEKCLKMIKVGLGGGIF